MATEALRKTFELQFMSVCAAATNKALKSLPQKLEEASQQVLPMILAAVQKDLAKSAHEALEEHHVELKRVVDTYFAENITAVVAKMAERLVREASQEQARKLKGR